MKSDVTLQMQTAIVSDMARGPAAQPLMLRACCSGPKTRSTANLAITVPGQTILDKEGLRSGNFLRK